MADPVSITGLVLQVGVLLKQLVEYGTAVKGAQGEIGRLRTELYAVKGVLRDLETAQEDAGKRPLKRELSETFTTAATVLGELARKLDGTKQSRIKSLVWPFDKPECNEILGKLERVKTWLMLYSMGEQQAGIGLLKDNLQDLTITVQEDIADRGARLQLDEQQAISRILASPPSEAVHTKACSAWQGVSPGAWFLDGHLRSWLSDAHPPSNMLLLSGLSGSGKTILMSRAAEWAPSLNPSSTNLLIARHYCLYNDEKSQKVTQILGSLVAQLAQHTPSILDHLDPKPTAEKQPEAAQLETCIATAAADGQVVLLVDALNESMDRNAIWQSLAGIAASCANMRIIVSSTPGVSDILDDNATCLQVNMAVDRSTPDMAVFVDQHIAHSKVLQRLPSEEVRDALLKKANGSFRWLELQMQYVAAQPTARRAMRALQSTPATLDAAYAAVLSRVPTESREMVKEALAWVAFASESLTLLELNEAVVIEDDQVDIDNTYRLVPPDVLLKLCHGFLDCSPTTSVVTFAHESVSTFLRVTTSGDNDDAYWHLDMDIWSRCIVRKCLTYLLMKPFQQDITTLGELRHLDATYPLMHFASTRWICDVQRGGKLDTAELDLVKRFFMVYRSSRTEEYIGPFGYRIHETPSSDDDSLDIELHLWRRFQLFEVTFSWLGVVSYEPESSILSEEDAFEKLKSSHGLSQVLYLLMRERPPDHALEAGHLAHAPSPASPRVFYKCVSARMATRLYRRP
nr:hypothetical protein B0A51_14984 [Rachicladosporium sp. CCFEE 5018]